jgi:hypothetical protein
MRKSLKRVLEQLRAATNGMFRRGTAARAGLQTPQRLQPLPVAAPTRP